MSLEPDMRRLPGDLPRHKLRAYGRVVRTPNGAEYRRLLNFLSKSAAQGERSILGATLVPKFAQVPAIMNRRLRALGQEAPADVSLQDDYPPFSITLDESIALPAPALKYAAVVESNTGERQFAPAGLPLPEDESPVVSVPRLNENVQQLMAKNPVEGEDAQFLSHLALLLNEWFDKENEEEDSGDDREHVDSNAKRRERAQALLNRGQKTTGEQKTEAERFLGRLNQVGNDDAVSASPALKREQQLRLKNREARRKELTHTTIPLADGMRREVYRDGSYILKDAVGRVTEVRSQDGTAMSFTYDGDGKFKSFVRSDLTGKIHTTGLKDRHGVVVRDASGAVRAQGDSMTVDTTGCVSIRKFDGQFWSLDVMRGIHIERRILEDADGGWNSLTALLTSDGFRMVTRFQKLQENNRESYRKYGDWLASAEASKFRFYGRDGSMIQFDTDEDLEALRPSRIWPAGSRPVEREWVGRRQAGTAWEAVHRYISQYLSAL